MFFPPDVVCVFVTAQNICMWLIIAPLQVTS